MAASPHHLRPVARWRSTRSLPAGLLTVCLPVVCLLLVSLATPGDVHAQQSHVSYANTDVQDVAPAVRLSTAHDLIKADRPAPSVLILRSIVRDDPAFTSSQHGPAAYWLGVALKQQDQGDDAYRAWRAGVRAFRDREGFSLLLSDAFLRSLTPVRLRDDRDLAVATYEAILFSMHETEREDKQEIYRHYAAQLAPMMSDEQIERMINQDRDAGADEWTFRPDAGDFLRAWWGQLDPLPATVQNERLEEHLARRVIAHQKYACTARISGLDDRGLVFLRFGAPGRTHVIDYQDSEFRDEVFRFGVSVTPREFPNNELWSYTSLSDAGYYIFTENSKKCYEISGAMDLLPSRLHQNRGSSKRAENISYSALMAMRYIFSELALFHVDFAASFSEISSYAMFQENRALAMEGRSTGSGDRASAQSEGAGNESQTVGAGFGQTRTVSSSRNFGIDSPSGFVSTMMTSLRHQDNAARHQRENNMPRQATELMSAPQPLPIAMRIARFLNPDGSTRTEVYWGVQKRDLRDEETAIDPSLLSFQAVQFDAGHTPSDRAQRRHLLMPKALNGNSIFVSPPVTMTSRSAPFHIGMQWSQFAVDSTDPAKATVRERLRFATLRADSLRPISASENELAMSDLRVMVSPSGTVSDAVSFPFSTIGPDTPLILYFELYHLTYDTDDRTRYKVAYEVEGRTQRGWTRVFRNDEIRRTSTEAEYTSNSRRTQEYIYLDLSKLRDKNTQDVRVTVRVTDTVMNTTKSRTTSFELVGTDRFK